MAHQEQAFFDALKQFDVEAAASPAAGPAALASPDICGTYQKVKPILDGILPILQIIPGFGMKVAAAVKALMAALDTFCAGADSSLQPASALASGDEEQ